jgi:hypothetical protein
MVKIANCPLVCLHHVSLVRLQSSMLTSQTRERDHHWVKKVKHKTSAASGQRGASYGMENDCKVIMSARRLEMINLFCFYHQER